MAYKHVFAFAQNDMPFIWNVSQHVGCVETNPNRKTDVELVQFLVRETTQAHMLGRHSAGGSTSPTVPLDGQFNAALGFWIYYAQTGGSSTAVVDGIVSPAKGTVYGTGAWVIAKLNYIYKQLNADAWLGLANDPRLSPMLRAELSNTKP